MPSFYYQQGVPRYHCALSSDRVSRENLRIGDLLYFSNDKPHRLVHFVVKLGNHIAFYSHLNYLKNVDKIYHSVIHCEMVVDIDAQGYAIIASVPAPGHPLRALRFKDYLQKITDKNLGLSSYIIVRHINPQYAKECARQMSLFLIRKVDYSTTSCVMAVAPTLLKPRDTSHRNEMMCQEIVFNALVSADKVIRGGLPETLHAQAAPAVGLYELLHCGFFVVAGVRKSEGTTANDNTQQETSNPIMGFRII